MKKLLIVVWFSWVLLPAYGQRIGVGTNVPHASALLEINSTTLGLLPPRMTAAQRNTIATPANGLIVFDTDSAALMLRSAGGWRRLTTTATPGGFWQISGTNIFNTNNGWVGIGTSAPQAALHVADSNVLFFAPGDAQLPLAPLGINGPGRRMLWFPGRAAFRVGYAINEWDQDSIGRYSFATGWRTRALSITSSAFGEFTRSSGGATMAMGSNTQASGYASLAAGFASTASAYAATALGYQTTATGPYSMAVGYSTKAIGITSFAAGYETMVTNNDAAAFGQQTWAAGIGSFAAGMGTRVKTLNGAVFGRYNDSTDAPDPNSAAANDRIFQIGNGTADNDRRNALTLLRNGRMGLGTTSPLARLHVADSSVVFTSMAPLPTIPGNTPVSGTGHRMMWYADKGAFRAGYAFNDAWDKDNIGYGSVALGGAGIATGNYSVALNANTSATGGGATAAGWGTSAKAIYSFALGSYNDITDNPAPNTATATDRLFQIGNGTISVRNNALTLLRNGNIGLGNVNTPNAPLQFNNALQNRKIILYEAANDDHRFYGFGINSGVLRYQTDASNADHVFYSAASASSSTELFRIKGNGAIGINQANPGVYGHGGTARVLEIWNNSGVDNDVQSHLVLSTSGGGGSMGGVTWATTALGGEQKAAFVGAAYESGSNNALFQVMLRNNGSLAQRFRVNSDGSAFLQGSLTQNSDATLKKNIEPISDAGALLSQLHGYRYQWKDENADAERQLGLLAQEVQKVLPELVKEGENGKLGVNYSGLIPVLLEALKEQQNELKRQRILNAKQDKLIEELTELVKKGNK